MFIFCNIFILFVGEIRVTYRLTKIKVVTPTMRKVFKTSIHLSKKSKNYAATKITLIMRIVEFLKIMFSSYLKQEHKRIARRVKAALTP